MTTSPVMTVTDELLAELESGVDHYHCSIPGDVVVMLTAELRRLRAENAELSQSLAESRANDQAAMGWLTSLRWASGDRGERMFPELVAYIEGLAKDAGRYRWLAHRPRWASAHVDFDNSGTYREHRIVWFSGDDWPHTTGNTLDAAIDTAMATQ